MIRSHKQLAASLLVSASLALSWGVFSPQQAFAASSASSVTASASLTGIIQSSVRLRTSPSTSGSVITYLSKGDQVVILEQTNSYWYKVRTASGEVGYTSSGDQYISVVAAPAVTPAVQTAVIQASVRLRETPSTSGKVLGNLKEGDPVVILEETNSYWYKVQTTNGTIGYTSSADRYIELDEAAVAPAPATPAPAPAPTPAPAPAPTPTPAPTAPAQSAIIDNVIAAGMKYLGTPYEFGSSRSNTSTFDCSDFIRQMFKDALNLTLPADSRQQGTWVRENSQTVTDISGLKRGDLMFFMDYKGSSASAYAGVNRFSERISHVAMYLGDGKILHTYSVASGGVRVDNLSSSWMNRFLYGGSVVR